MQAREINDVNDFLAESIGNLIKAVVFLLAKTGFCHHCGPHESPSAAAAPPLEKNG